MGPLGGKGYTSLLQSKSKSGTDGYFNERLLGPNTVMKEVLRQCGEMDLNQYPAPYSDGLRQSLATTYGLEMDNFIAGNGSDEMLDIIFKTFLNPGEAVVAPYPSYVLHGFFVTINHGKFQTIDLKPAFKLDADDLLKAKGKIIILCTPNNPTANSFDHHEVERIVKEHDGPVIVDEAYGEYADDSFISKVQDHENLIVTRTFSKAYGLAGLRIGYMASNKEMADAMQRVKIPYSLDRISEKAAIAALTNSEYLNEGVRIVKEQRVKLSEGLSSLGFQVYPSGSNFILFKVPHPSSELVSRLAAKGILIRDFGKNRMLEDCVRTTIGTEELNQMLLLKLKEVMEEWL